jgi:hypothetical protein
VVCGLAEEEERHALKRKKGKKLPMDRLNKNSDPLFKD